MDLGGGDDGIAEYDAHALGGEYGPNGEAYENSLEQFRCLEDFGACGVGVHEFEILSKAAKFSLFIEQQQAADIE